MKLDGRRESSNVEDRRRMSGGQAAGLGIGGILIVGLITLLMGGDLGDVMQTVQSVGGGIGTEQEVATGEFTPEEQALATFSKQILASTEDVWSAYFKKHNLGTYRNPILVLYTGTTSTSCGTGQSAMGPFYCSADERLYIDLSFFSTMKRSLGADGDFAYAYVIAHEVGHHVQNLLGTLGSAHKQMSRMSSEQANRISVGYAVEESFTHGTAAQRMRWLKKGLTTGDISQGDTFSVSDRNL